ncbi:hypothetical protein [Halobacillus yeomjeoni]|uniref:Uncharacterized protein n=1 Tax=Halobacillus yeomjeoni TaxID=311194 RepID=A0A931MTH8_9BACI|nr:hypothetical protein [Halobacillus yeomjeoni]MBH0228928.1 hypothetical protein [Halobacillus yeomjeoni]
MKSTINAILNRFSSVIDHAIAADRELYRYVYDHYKVVHIAPHFINVENYDPSYPKKDNKGPLIVHPPSNRNLKGTHYLLEAVQKLNW